MAEILTTIICTSPNPIEGMRKKTESGKCQLRLTRNLLNICNIERISDRSMAITLKTSDKNKIKIINTCAPHMGYNAGGRTKYWKEISNITRQTDKKDCIIWCTDNNGQIGKMKKIKIQEYGHIVKNGER